MLQYLLKLTISLSIVYLFYQLFLRRLTFYNWNRWYLLIYSMVCFVIPVINVFTIIVKQPALRESALVNYIPAITQISPATASVGIDWWLVGAVVFIVGIVVMLVRLLVQYYSLFKMRSKAVLLYDNKVKLYHIDAPVMPFSFGRGIYVNQHQHSEHELKEIIRHEFIHVKQRHTLDIVWSELLCLLNWYNPFAWLLRHDIRQNLEFIADHQVLQTGFDRKQYQYLLLKVIGVNSFSIANNFNFSSLKKRIAMMNKAQSARVNLIRFLFLLPLLVVVLLAFRNSTQINRQFVSSLVTDTIPAAAKVPPGLKEVSTIDVNDNKATVRLKNKKIEKYDLNNPKEKDAFEQKYGPLPAPPPPPVAPTMPTAPEPLNQVLIDLAPIAPDSPNKLAPVAPEAPIAPVKILLSVAPQAPPTLELTPVPPPPPPPVPAQEDCYNKKGFCITVVDNRGEATVIVKDKSNKIVLAVSLNDWNKDKQYEDKYGEVPPRQIILLPKTVMGNKLRLKTVKPAIVKNDENSIGDNTYNTTYRRKYLPMYSVTPDSNVWPVIIVRGRPNARSVAKSTPSPYVKMAEIAKEGNMIATNNKIVTVKIVKGSSMDKAGGAEARPQLAEVKRSTDLINLTPVAKPSAEADKAAQFKPKPEIKKAPDLINLTPMAKPDMEPKKAAEAKPAAPTKEQ
ncbi:MULTISPECIES: M56 family metallopeptidase [Niastella]|uniref:Peptidase M56 domain-containing protein n=1 Tax=Niastella soli TaxID=2821487 RepID=A0ABS3YTE5_9BACT|nr:M56 family metallopeptidase [Niastella soli]MBO9201073.1 hypothetical protein [Niastella soli]